MARIIQSNDLVKFCPKCKNSWVGYRNILGAFGRDKARWDHLSVYCRSCRQRPTVNKIQKTVVALRLSLGRSDG